MRCLFGISAGAILKGHSNHSRIIYRNDNIARLVRHNDSDNAENAH